MRTTQFELQSTRLDCSVVVSKSRTMRTVFMLYEAILVACMVFCQVASQKCGKPAIQPNVATESAPKASAGGPLPPKPSILNGIQAVPHSWPWQVYMEACKSGNIGCRFCGGSLITRNKVLTAAHCVYNRDDGTIVAPANIVVRLGTHDTRSQIGTESGDLQLGVRKVTVHEGWSYATFSNDIAILTLDKKVNFTDTISQVCLPMTDPPAGTVCYLTGWGYTEAGWKSILQQVAAPVSTNENCQKEVNGPIDGKMCADVTGGKDTCHGDSGGPYVCKASDGTWQLVGITSYGNADCGTDGRPGIYAKVSYYKPWIYSNLMDWKDPTTMN